ncbi:MAG: hypothetical protein L6E13_02395 [Firmicutes bacterium]|nr:hypothetical protein [Bacillota bacterium]
MAADRGGEPASRPEPAGARAGQPGVREGHPGAREGRLTEMELQMLTHALDAEATLVRKCLHYAGEMQDEEARRLLQGQAAVHRRHFDQLLALLTAGEETYITTVAKQIIGT